MEWEKWKKWKKWAKWIKNSDMEWEVIRLIINYLIDSYKWLNIKYFYNGGINYMSNYYIRWLRIIWIFSKNGFQTMD